MKQLDIFGNEKEPIGNDKYISKIKTPVYEPKNKKPHVLELIDRSKTKRMLNEINSADIPEDVKKFLSISAERHTVFNYEKIADFYAQSDTEVQKLMERQALVIIDFNKAYQYGYVKLAHELANQYFDD